MGRRVWMMERVAPRVVATRTHTNSTGTHASHTHLHTYTHKTPNSRGTSAGRRWRWASPSRRCPSPQRPRSVAVALSHCVGRWAGLVLLHALPTPPPLLPHAHRPAGAGAGGGGTGRRRGFPAVNRSSLPSPGTCQATRSGGTSARISRRACSRQPAKSSAAFSVTA